MTLRTALGVVLFVVLLGGSDGAVGVVWPTLRGEFERPTGDLGLLPLAGTAPYLLASALAGRASRRVGAGAYIAAAACAGAAGLALWAAAPNWPIVLAAFALQGLACGALDAAVNAQVAAEHGIKRLGLLHASYGVGATGGPVLATVVLVAGVDWRWVPVALTAPTVLAAAAAVALRRTWPPPTPPSPEDAPTGAAMAGTSATAPVVVTLVLFFVYVALEASVAFWAFTFLTEARGLDDGAAGTWTALFWGALTAGRFALAALGDRARRDRLLHLCCLTGLLGTVVLWLDPAGIGAVGIPLTGIGLSAVFPLLIDATGTRVGAHRAASVIGWSVAAAAAGGPIGVAALGRLADSAGLEHLPAAMTAIALAVVAANAAAARTTASASSRSSRSTS